MRRIEALLAALLCVACAHDVDRPPSDAGPWPESEIHAAVADFLGPERIQVLRAPDSVQAFRVQGDPLTVPETTGKTLAGWPLLASGPELTPDQVRRFQQLAFDGTSYEFNMAKACIFAPGVALRFRHGPRTVVALLCFSCDEWGFELGGELVTEDFDSVRPELVRLARELFPEDDALRGLREDR